MKSHFFEKSFEGFNIKKAAFFLNKQSWVLKNKIGLLCIILAHVTTNKIIFADFPAVYKSINNRKRNIIEGADINHKMKWSLAIFSRIRNAENSICKKIKKYDYI